VDYALKRRASGEFGAVTQAVERSIAAHGFVVVGAHDMHVTLAHKGFTIHPVRIYEIRDRDRGSHRLADALAGRISVFIESGEVVVAAVRPGIVAHMFPDDGLEEAARDLEHRIARIVEAAVDGAAEERVGR
jgi:hypothetical protein